MAYLIFAISFIIRIIYIIQLKSTIVYSRFMLDEAFYNTWAQQIASGDFLGKDVFSALPFYPYALGVIYKIFGYNLFLPRLVEVIVSSLCCSLLYIIGKRYFSKLAGIIAGLMAAFYAPFIFYSGLLVPATFVLFFCLLVLLILDNLIRAPRFPGFLLFGIACAVASLARASILLFLFAALVWLLIILTDKRRAVIGALLALAGALIIIMPVFVRNYIVSGDTACVTSHAGVNFYIGNNENADGRFKAPFWARTSIEGLKQDSKTIAEAALKKPLKDSEVSDYFFDKAFSFIRENPVKFIKLLGTKLFLFINAQELYDVAHHKAYSDIIPILRFPFLSFMIIGPLGIAGMLMAIGQIRRLMAVYLFTISYIVTILLYFVNSRYRIPFAGICLLFAGYFIAWLWQAFNRKKFIEITGAAFLASGLIFVVNMPTNIETISTGYINLGSIYMEANRANEAIDMFNKAIELSSISPKPYHDIGYIYLMQGSLDKADKYLSQSLKIDPEYVFAIINKGLLYDKRGDMKSAEREYKRAISLNPNIAEAHNNLAILYAKTGREYLAVVESEKAVELDPQSANKHYTLGIMYGRIGKINEAKRELEKAVALDPEFTPAQEALSYF